jgi:hypothetical protein
MLSLVQAGPSLSLSLPLLLLSLGGTCVGIALGHLGFAMDKYRV